MTKDQMYDVVIIGTGLSGTMLGSILGRHGFSVLMVDGTQHPRFAVGESTIGQTLTLLNLLAQRYKVPELAHLASFEAITQHLGGSHGQKTNFGFMVHQDGQEPDPAQFAIVPIPKFIGAAAHFFRQDTDAYMFHTAIRYGCQARQNFQVEKVELAEDKVTVIGSDGSRYQARYIVDASGFRAPLAHQLGLRETPTRLKHHARSIFTHMIGVDAIDDHMQFAPGDVPPTPFNEGTLHHVFERGWMWIIPFNNHKGATNPLCSVGIQLDPRRYPLRADLSPEEEFWEHVRRFPAVERQLAGARSVREWVRTDRMQYSSSRTVGHRWCLMSHAAGFLDPLFSRGLSNTCEVINTLAWRLMDALRRDAFSAEQFAYVERLEQGLLDYNDKLVNSSFISFSNFDMWNAVIRIWSSASVIGGKRLLNALSRTQETGDDRFCRSLDDNPYPGLWCPYDFYAELVEKMNDVCEAVHEGRMDAQDAGDLLLRSVTEADWMLPSLGFNDPAQRFIGGSAEEMMQLAEWARQHPRLEIRELLSAPNSQALKNQQAGAGVG